MKKILIGLGIFLALLIGSIILLPIIFKDKIVAKVKTEINNNVNAKADFKSFDLTLLSSFPDFTFTLNDFSIIGIKEFEGDGKSCPVVPTNLPFHKKFVLFFFR